MIVFQPKEPRQVYFKKYLHPDEEQFFVSGNRAVELLGSSKNVALAICYELSVPDHAEKAYQCGSQIYLASVAKTVSGVEKAMLRLSDIANKYAMVTLMSNCVGKFDGSVSGGKSSVWNNKGVLIGQLDDKNEGILIFDGKETVSKILIL
jgi:predicted amidohydrolase